MQQNKTYLLRISSELLNLAKDKAKEEGRTLANLINYLLKKYLGK